MADAVAVQTPGEEAVPAPPQAPGLERGPVDELASPAPRRTVKPIPPQTPAESGAAKAAPTSDRPRNPDGTFRTPGEQAVVDAAGKADAQPAATPPKFKFAGREWANEDEAAQTFRSLHGQSAAMRKVTAEHAAAQARIAALEQRLGIPAGHDLSAPPPPPPPEYPDVLKLPEDLQQELDTAEALLGPRKADRLLLVRLFEKLRQYVDHSTDSVASRFSPLIDQQQHLQRASDLFHQVAERTEGEGEDLTPLFPELRDEGARSIVVDIWNRMDAPDEFRLSPSGIVHAVLLYRSFVSRTLTAAQKKAALAALAASSGSAPLPPGAPVRPAPPADIPSGPPPNGRVSGDDVEAFRRAIRESGGDPKARAHLGFDR